MAAEKYTRILRKACKLTHAEWAVVMRCENDDWVIGPNTGLRADRLHQFGNMIASVNMKRWVEQTAVGSRVRTKKIGGKDLVPDRVYGFPSASEDRVFIVGAEHLDTDQKEIFRLLDWVSESPGENVRMNGKEPKPIDRRYIQAARLAAVGEMAAGVAHELNNPLTTIAGFAELILDDLPKDAAQREDLELILKEAQRARSVVRRLLDFSREGESIKSQTDVNELVGEVLAIIHHHARTGGIDMHLSSRVDLPKIFIDRNQIKQVVLNLVHNAIQAMPRGGEMRLQTLLEKKDGRDWVVITVEDSGVGIAEENLERVFEPFFTTKPTGIGTGLGLSISYRIVSDHDGYIEVNSKDGEGSIFSIWLPLDRNER